MFNEFPEEYHFRQITTVPRLVVGFAYIAIFIKWLCYVISAPFTVLNGTFNVVEFFVLNALVSFVGYFMLRFFHRILPKGANYVFYVYEDELVYFLPEKGTSIRLSRFSKLYNLVLYTGIYDRETLLFVRNCGNVRRFLKDFTYPYIDIWVIFLFARVYSFNWLCLLLF